MGAEAGGCGAVIGSNGRYRAVGRRKNWSWIFGKYSALLAAPNRSTGTQIISAYFGLAPTDFDVLLGLYTYLKRLPELPQDGRTYLTADFIAKQLQLPATSQGD